PQTEAKWIEEASRLSCRAVEALVARACFGDSPEKARGRKAGEGVGVESVPLVLRVRPEVKAAFEAALRAALKATEGDSLEEALVYMTEKTLEGVETAEADEEAGTGARMDGPRFQVVLYKCEACGGATLGQEGPVAPPSLEARAACDAETVAIGSGEGPEGTARKTIPPKARRGVLLRDGLRCVVPGCTNRPWVEVHHLVPRAAGGSNGAGNLVTLCSPHHGLVHEGNLRHMRGEEGRLRWFGRTGREIGRATHVGRRDGAGVGDNGSPIGATAPASAAAAATVASPAA
ncbi:MAG: HNH endonuclease, partial [Planctomycetes bacterium]|nr:HNH endonuclease [Planctomycetota bacterium]